MRALKTAATLAALLCLQHHLTSDVAAESDPSFGSWTPGDTAPEGFLSTHATLLTDGRILSVGGSSYYFYFDYGKESAHFYDVAANVWSARLPSPAPYGPDRDAFCSGHVHDDQGGVIFQGGLRSYTENGHGIVDSARFNLATGRFVPLGPAATHWYPTLVAGVDGTYIFPGTETHYPGDSGPTGYQVRRLRHGQTVWEGTGANIRTTATYPRVHLLPNGTFFIASPQNDNWTNTVYNPATGAVSAFGTAESQKVPRVGAYSDGSRPMFSDWGGTSVLLPLAPVGTTYPSPKVALLNSERAYVRNVGAASSSWVELGTRPSELPLKLRRHANATLLPTGQVLVTGGINVVMDADAVRGAEVYDPDLGQWLLTTTASVPRNYHSVALLLPDGRVWTASSSIDQSGSCGARADCPPWQREKTQRAVEFFRPWYVGHSDRPAISNCPSRIVTSGQQFTISIGGGLGNTIGRVALMRPGSVTHAFDGDQRLVWLDIVSKTASSIVVRAPYTANVAPPGDYMIFALRDRGATQRFKRYAPSPACWTRVASRPSPPGASIWQHTGDACSGESCPGWRRLDNNPRSISLAVDRTTLYQLHGDGWIWRHTGTPCNGDGCPGWVRLDNNQKTVALVAAGGRLYQLHNDGWIWRHTGTACTGDSCPGWQRLDNNSKTIAISANDTSLYQLHNDGWIFRSTGSACSGESCAGWQRLDNNHRTIAIAAAGTALFQLHRDGRIWRHTGAACSGESCSGWQMLDNNPATVAIAASHEGLFQLHFNGSIWEHTGVVCSGDSCPGWRRLDNNGKTIAIAAGTAGLIQQHNDGWIWQYTGTPCTGESCPGWRRLDNNPRTGSVVAGASFYQLHSSPLYQRHSDGAIWRFTGTECEGEACPGWERLDNNAATAQIVAAGRQLYQRHGGGAIWRWTGISCGGDTCPGWERLDNNPNTISIAAGGGQLFQLHRGGRIWRYTGKPCAGESCPNWQMLDNNPATVQLAASETQLFQRHSDGSVWRHTGRACAGTSCPGWERLDNNSATSAIAASGNQLYQLHRDGKIWRHTGKPCAGDSCAGWQMIDNNPGARSITAAGAQLFQLHNDGKIWRFTGRPCTGTSCPGWQMLDNNPRTREVVASGTQLYQRHDNRQLWRYGGPPCSGSSCPGWRRLDNNPRTADIEAAH